MIIPVYADLLPCLLVWQSLDLFIILYSEHLTCWAVLIIKVQTVREGWSWGQADKVATSSSYGWVTMCFVGEHHVHLCLNCLLAEMTNHPLWPEAYEVAHMEIIDWGVLSLLLLINFHRSMSSQVAKWFLPYLEPGNICKGLQDF